MRNLKTLLTYDDIEEYRGETEWKLYGIGQILHSIDPDVTRGKDFCVRISSGDYSEAFTTWEQAESHLIKQIQRMMQEAMQGIDEHTKQYIRLSKTFC